MVIHYPAVAYGKSEFLNLIRRTGLARRNYTGFGKVFLAVARTRIKSLLSLTVAAGYKCAKRGESLFLNSAVGR